MPITVSFTMSDRVTSCNKCISAVGRVRQYEEYAVLYFSIVLLFGRADTASLELNITPYALPSCNNIYTHIHIVSFISNTSRKNNSDVSTIIQLSSSVK